MFVLFTSHAALRRAANELRLALGNRWPILVQGESPRDVLLRRFRELENAILLGTDSFWEGVDVPGRALRTLVLNKLPFKVPSGVTFVEIDKDTGKLAGPNCERTMKESFLAGTEPVESCPLHNGEGGGGNFFERIGELLGK